MDQRQDVHPSQAKNTFKEKRSNNNISHKPQSNNINYIKNRSSPLLHMLLIYAMTMIMALNTPHLAIAHESTSLELNDHTYGSIEMRMRNESQKLNIDQVEMHATAGKAEIEERNEFSPKFRDPEKLLNIQSKPTGSFVRLSCSAIGNPQPNITWTRNGTEIVRILGKVRLRKWAMDIEDLMPEDSGSYVCRVCNYLGCIEHVSKLIINDRVNHKPIVLRAPANLTLPINGSGLMNCEYLSDLYQSMAWTFTACNSTAGCSVNRRIIKQDVGVLEFINVKMEDEGWYTCIAANSLGQSISSAYLHIVNNSSEKLSQRTVREKPTHQFPPIDLRKEFSPEFRDPEKLLNIQSKPSGSYIRLSCLAIGNPQPNITWTRNGTEIVHILGKVSLSKWAIDMEDLVPEDSGSYVCRVCNYLGCIEHVSKLIINDRLNHKPIVLRAPANLTLPINGSGRMNCEYLSDLHQSMAWTLTACYSTAGCSVNRKTIKQDGGALEFKNVTMKDEGWYTCIAANSLGQSISSAYLHIVNNSLEKLGRKAVTEKPTHQIPQIEEQEEFAPKFRNPKELLNIQSKPSGSFIQLSCPAIGNPLPNITWTRNGTDTVRILGKVRFSKWAIDMKDLVPEDSGSYVCRVCNYLGCIEHVSKLIINDRLIHKPIVLQALDNLTLPINGSGRMACPFSSDLHHSLTWTFKACDNSTADCSLNNTIIKMNVSVLEFKNVTTRDEGWYTCIVASNLGHTMNSAYLHVESGATSISKMAHGHFMWIGMVVTTAVIQLRL